MRFARTSLLRDQNQNAHRAWFAVFLLQVAFFVPQAGASPGHADPCRGGWTAPCDGRGADEVWERLIDLRGHWFFRIGDDLAWKEPTFYDKGWDEIFVPSSWENEGFPGYDGYAWYRRHFRMSEAAGDRTLFIDVGRIDDVDAVYVNGHYVGGSGKFPPDFQSAYHMFRRYRVPTEFIRPAGDNVVALRVYDDHLEGGILEGQIGLYERIDAPRMTVDLDGIWRFMPGDERGLEAPNRSTDDWYEITVPGYWEKQGFEDLDGFAWYRKDFELPARLPADDLVLYLGRIDDMDEVYLNGVFIGGVGDLDRHEVQGYEYSTPRTYALPGDVLLPGLTNVLAIRVYDGLIDGGIYEGPIGILPRDEAARWFPAPNEESDAWESKPFSLWDLVRSWIENE